MTKNSQYDAHQLSEDEDLEFEAEDSDDDEDQLADNPIGLGDGDDDEDDSEAEQDLECGECGSAVASDDAFCAACGVEFETEEGDGEEDDD